MLPIYTYIKGIRCVDHMKYDDLSSSYHSFISNIYGLRITILMQYSSIISTSLFLKIVSFIIVYIWSINILAQTQIADTNKLSTKELDELINALENRNDPPSLADDNGKKHGPLFDPYYSWVEQDRVIKALDTLTKRNSDVLLPLLIKYLEDKRYSLTTKINGTEINMTIGFICWNIAYNDLIYPFRGWPNYSDIPNVISGGGKVHFPPPRQNLKEWYQARKDKTLWELQVEVGEWAIKTLEDAKEISDKDKSLGLKMTKEAVDKLRKTKNPIVFYRFPYEMNCFDAQKAKDIREKYIKSAVSKDK
jgi:hypothetical protein